MPYYQDWESLPTHGVNMLIDAVNGIWRMLEEEDDVEGYYHTFVCEKPFIAAGKAAVSKVDAKASTSANKDESSDTVLIRELTLMKYQLLEPINKIMEKLDKLEERMGSLELKIKEKEKPEADLLFETFESL